MKTKFFLILLLFVLSFSSILFCQEYEQKSLNVTIYNNDLGVVRDIRNINVISGISDIKITGVAENIDPTSVHIKLDGNVLEQNYQYDLVSFSKILNKYIDKEIMLIGDKVISGTLLSSSGSQIVIKKSDGGLTMLNDIKNYQISVGELPEGLITKPTLIWTVQSKKSGKQDVELSYQTTGLGWHAEYVAVLNEKDTKMGLNSWVSISNNSGATYKNANLKLVAGDVNIVPKPMVRTKAYYDEMTSAGEPESPLEEKSFFEYHIYQLQRPSTIANNEIKQISLFEASNVEVQKKYIYSGSSYYSDANKVNVVVEFENNKNNNLGIPMPKGKIRLYKSDGNSIEFIGEDLINHTPKDEKVKLNIGNAFDIVVEDIVEDSKKIADKVNEESYKITIKNRKEEDVTVEVHRYLGLNWEILSSSLKYDKKDAYTVIFKVPVKKNEEKELKFKVRYSH